MSAVVTAIILTVAVLISGFMGIFSFLENRKTVITSNADKASAIAQTVAAGIDADAYDKIVASGEKNDYWYEVTDFLSAMKIKTGVLYAYAMFPIDASREITCFTEGSAPGDKYEPSDLGEKGDAATFPEELFQAMNTKTAAMSGIFDGGEFGHAVAGFAPILNGEDRVVGVVGIELCVDDVLAPVNRFGITIAAVAALITAAAAAAAITLTRRMISRPLKAVAAASQQLTAGDMDITLSIKSVRELNALADTFNALVDVIRTLTGDLSRIAQGYINGDRSSRIEAAPYKGAYKNIAEGINAYAHNAN